VKVILYEPDVLPYTLINKVEGESDASSQEDRDMTFVPELVEE